MAQALRHRALCASLVATAALVASAVASTGVAQGRVDPSASRNDPAVVSPDTVAKATGGGTIYLNPPANTQIGSFGINGKRPPGFAAGQGGPALGRINFDAHANIVGRHINVPVTYMLAEIASPQTGNQTGGHAQLIGDCGQPQTDCSGGPVGTQSVLVDVVDNSDSGAGNDTFSIAYCAGTPQEVAAGSPCYPATFSGTLRTGNIQIRTNVSGGGMAPTAARAPLRLP